LLKKKKIYTELQILKQNASQVKEMINLNLRRTYRYFYYGSGRLFRLSRSNM